MPRASVVKRPTRVQSIFAQPSHCLCNYTVNKRGKSAARRGHFSGRRCVWATCRECKPRVGNCESVMVLVVVAIFAIWTQIGPGWRELDTCETRPRFSTMWKVCARLVRDLWTGRRNNFLNGMIVHIVVVVFFCSTCLKIHYVCSLDPLTWIANVMINDRFCSSFRCWFPRFFIAWQSLRRIIFRLHIVQGSFHKHKIIK